MSLLHQGCAHISALVSRGISCSRVEQNAIVKLTCAPLHPFMSVCGLSAMYLYLPCRVCMQSVQGVKPFRTMLPNALSRLPDIPSKSDLAETCSILEHHFDKVDHWEALLLAWTQTLQLQSCRGLESEGIACPTHPGKCGTSIGL